MDRVLKLSIALEIYYQIDIEAIPENFTAKAGSDFWSFGSCPSDFVTSDEKWTANDQMIA